MLVYNLLLLWIIISGIFLCEIHKDNHHIKLRITLFIVLSSIAMIILASLRGSTVGIDYPNYSGYFTEVYAGIHKQGATFLLSNANIYRPELGYSFLNYVVALFTNDVHIFMAVASIVVIGLTAVLVYKYSPIPWVSMFVFVSFGFFGNSLNFIRQCIAIAIFLFSIKYLKEKRFLPYIGIVVLAASFHKVMWIMIPLFFIARIKVNWKSLTVYGGLTALIMGLSWPLFNLITKYVYKYYATKEGLYYMMGRDWQTAAIPVITTVTLLIVKKFILQRDPKNVVLINFSIYSGLLYIMTCQHFLFQRFGMIFFTSAILIIPELLASVGVNNEQVDVLRDTESLKIYKNKDQKKKALQERRQIKSSQNMRKYIYYYAAAAVLFIGFLYNVWILMANRVNLIPYVTFFAKK
ncbi:EpsG family protein [Caproiciproducens sp. CPB-2]|uniref:EpsG family protein n=1 Tax=Caproiciproducens sp. CPB-2 TaxID=3030017 RepID=UPI0023DC3BFB|nr:EpsG family protein [Caproiciproducens sp. CPB-2]MDF1494083.1 EpsG family protein [Caproiciproducens sp. CPB-2]